MNNTIIENINALMRVKQDLNQVLVENEQPGGPVFDEYPEQFRELFRILDNKLGDIEEGPYANVTVKTVVADPVITCVDNVIKITCLTQGAAIYYSTDSIGWGQYGISIYINKDTYVQAYAILNGVRSSTVSKMCYYTKPDDIEPPVISRSNGIVTMTHDNPEAAIWYRKISDNYWTRYEGPVNISDTVTIEAYASYINWGSETVISEGSGEVFTVADPVFDCVNNYVTISCETTDVAIWYKRSTDSSWTRYNGPIQITENTAFTAYAYKEGNISNEVQYTATYIPPVVPVIPEDPVFSISNNVVTISCSTIGAVIYYRVYGASTWNTYTSGITITEDTVFEAYSSFNGTSSENTVTYNAVYVPPVVRPANPVISCSNNEVTITCSTSGATIYYSTDGSNYSVYTQSVTISQDTTFYAYSSKDGVVSETVTYNAEYTNYNNEYLSIKILEDAGYGNFRIWQNSHYWVNFKYSLNNGEWKSPNYGLDYNMIQTTLHNGDIIRLKLDYFESGWHYGGSYDAPIIDLRKYTSDDPDEDTYFQTYRYEVFGNPLSLWLGDNFTNITDLTQTMNVPVGNSYSQINFTGPIIRFGHHRNYLYGRPNLPENKLIYANNLALNFTVLSPWCYESMFCYRSDSKYYGMTNLIAAPVLPAATLNYGCYDSMFNKCSSLDNIKCLSTPEILGNNPQNNPFNYWVNEVSSTGTFIKKTNTNWSSGRSGIPTGWTVQEADS